MGEPYLNVPVLNGEARTLTFCFTDIEGSTVRWERHPEAMALALREHDRILRHAIENNGGRVFKTVGDAFYAVFERVPDAVAAALAAQRAIAASDWSQVDGLAVRVAIHTGPVETRDDDFFGTTLNRSARLVGIAHGGQIILSGVAASLAEAALPQRASIVDLGEHRLKDLARSEHVFQLAADGIRSLFPPLRSLSVLPNNLPAQLTSFVGRSDDLAETRRLLASNRILTIVGAGGIGKTRIALALASELLAGYTHGVFFVEVAPLTEANSVVDAVTSALGIGSTPTASAERQLLDFLATRQILLIFDNCEHLIAEVARLALEIVRAAPDVSIVATSREALRIPGEQRYKLPSLAVPAADADVAFAEIEATDAVALFVSRAQAADSRFKLTASNAGDVAEICRRVDGIALAIELAAARIPTLSPAKLRARISSRLAVLTGGNRTAVARQSTVRALVDWSFDMLDDGERRLFTRLSVFADSFSLEATMAIGRETDEIGDEFDTLDLLVKLVDKSLVVADVSDGEARYRMLETIREYAAERLRASAEAERVFARFTDFYVDFVERCFVLWAQAPSKVWEAFASPEIPNVRAALGLLLAGERDPQRGITTIARARRLFARIAPAEGTRWIAAARERISLATPAKVLADLDLAQTQMLTTFQQPTEALACAERAIARYEPLGDALGLAEARGFAGLALTMLGSIERGEALLHEAIATYERLDERQLGAYALSDLALSRYFDGDVNAATSLFRRARDAFAALANERAAAVTTANLADAEFGMGHAGEALALIDTAIAADSDSRYLATYHANRAMYLTALERFDEAREAARASLRRARGAGADVEIATALKHFVALTALRDGADETRLGLASRILAAAERRIDDLGAVSSPTNASEDARTRAALARALGPDRLAELEEEGRAWPIDRAIAEAGTL